MGNKCEIDKGTLDRIDKYPKLADESIQAGIFTKQQLKDCRQSDDGMSSLGGRMKGLFNDAATLVEGVSSTLAMGAGRAVVNEVTNNTGLAGGAADALKNRGRQLSSMDM